eukprot:scaffold118447_cov31-Tisochrysis_lutea.AAC.1
MATFFSKPALLRHWERLVTCGVAEWRGVWTRYHMVDNHLLAAPSFSALCALKTGGQEAGRNSLPVIEQTNTYFEPGCDAAPRVVPMPVQSIDSFIALPSEQNTLIVLPDDNALIWSTLDFAALPQSQASDRDGRPRVAAVELVCRFRSNRARIVVLYQCNSSSAAETVWNLVKFTSIRDSCLAGPQDVPRTPGTDIPHFMRTQPALSDGWIWEVKKVSIAGDGHAPRSAPSGSIQWDFELSESKSSGSLDGPLVDHLSTSTARSDVSEPDILVHAPTELRFGDLDGRQEEANISLTWSPEKDVCLRVAVHISANGRLKYASSLYWRHLHWKAAT